MSFSRRRFIATASSVATVGSALPMRYALAQGGPIKLGSVLDNSGNLDVYGKPMVQATQMAAEEINAAGGLLGRKIEVKQYDTQSDIALYTKYAQQLARDDKVDVVHGGITSASREAIRQTFRRANTLYFYNVLYEGGVCDRNCFVHRHDAGAGGRADRRPRDEAVGQEDLRAGRRLQLRPDHRQVGGALRQAARRHRSRRPASSRSTWPTSARRSPRSRRPSPMRSCAALVGGAHLSFFRQWAASGMNKKIPLFSTTFGVGNEHLALSAGRGRRHPDRRQLQPGRRRRRPTRSSSHAGPSASATPRSCTRSRCRSTRASSCGPRRSRRPARSIARSCSRRSKSASPSRGRRAP